jgi:hypothetical protein
LPLLKRMPDLDSEDSTNSRPIARNSTTDDLDTLMAERDCEPIREMTPLEKERAEAIERMLANIDALPEPSTDAAESLPECLKEPAPEFTEVSKTPEPEFTKVSKTGSVFDNPVNESRYVSVYRDAKTMRQIRALHDNPDFTGDATLLVSKALFHFTPRYKPDPYQNYKPWWHESERPDLPSPARQYRTSAPWRDTSDHLKVTFRHVAINGLGPVFDLSLNLSPDIEALARDQAYPLGWIHRRISLYLKRALQRQVEFHLVMEETGSARRMHLHGEMQIGPEEAKEARAAIRKAGGVWAAGAKNKQAVARPNPDAIWLNYITLDLQRLSFTRNMLPRLTLAGRLPSSAITFAGSATCSNDLLNKRAAEIYEAHRALIKKHKSKLT